MLTRTCLCLLTREVNGRQEVLLGRKKRGFGAGKWVGLGGHIEPGETPAEAAAREVAEESGLIVSPRDLRPAAALTFLFPYRPAWDQTADVFAAASFTGEARESEEIEPRWFAAGELPLAGMWDDARYWLPRALAGEQVSATVTFAADCDTVAVIVPGAGRDFGAAPEGAGQGDARMPDAASRFGQYAQDYDDARPTPPAELVRFLARWAGAGAPEVADIGAGTGLSTMIWAGTARRVTAVEPDAAMRRVLAAKTAGLAAAGSRSPGPDAGGPAATRFTVAAGTAEETGLPDACADIVTVSQAMHWFDASRALPEFARVLRPGGVLAAYDCDWPPAVNDTVDAAFTAHLDLVTPLEEQHGVRPRHAGKEHRATFAASGLFRYVSEVALHSQVEGTAGALVAAALSQGGARALLDQGLTEDDIGVTALRAAAARAMPGPRPWWWTYRVRLAVR